MYFDVIFVVIVEEVTSIVLLLTVVYFDVNVNVIYVHIIVILYCRFHLFIHIL